MPAGVRSGPAGMGWATVVAVMRPAGQVRVQDAASMAEAESASVVVQVAGAGETRMAPQGCHAGTLCQLGHMAATILQPMRPFARAGDWLSEGPARVAQRPTRRYQQVSGRAGPGVVESPGKAQGRASLLGGSLRASAPPSARRQMAAAGWGDIALALCLQIGDIADENRSFFAR
jgi:hypothetical protein